MGNAISPTTGDILKTAAISKYMKLTKPQVLAMRAYMNSQRQTNSRLRHRGTIPRKLWHQAMEAALITAYPDQDILHLLFTMWDGHGTGRVACNEFLVGISVLACRYDGVEDALRFALEVADVHETQKISSRDASAVLRSICATATYFGDQLLHLRQIYKVVDAVYETITLISQDFDDLSHDEFTKLILAQSLVQGVVATGSRRREVAFDLNNEPSCVSNSLVSDTLAHNLGSSQSSSSDDDENGIVSFGRKLVLEQQQQEEQKRMQQQQQSAPHIYSALDFSSESHTSSLPLKPITRISIHTSLGD